MFVTLYLVRDYSKKYPKSVLTTEASRVLTRVIRSTNWGASRRVYKVLSAVMTEGVLLVLVVGGGYRCAHHLVAGKRRP